MPSSKPPPPGWLRLVCIIVPIPHASVRNLPPALPKVLCLFLGMLVGSAHGRGQEARFQVQQTSHLADQVTRPSRGGTGIWASEPQESSEGLSWAPQIVPEIPHGSSVSSG